MVRTILRIALVAFLAAATPQLRAQEVTASARVDSSAITIGVWLRVTLELRSRGTVTVLRPEFTDSLRGLEVVGRETPPVTQENGETIARTVLTVTAFDSGRYEFPAVRVPYTVGSDTTPRYASTGPIAIVVHGVVVDTAQAIKDIKPPLSLPLTFLEVLPYLVGALLVAALVWLFFYIRKKRRRGESILPAAPPRPAHEIAFEEIAALESESLWQRGMVKEFHSRVTGIVRQYIEDRFQVRALEQTSDEVLSADAIRALAPEATDHLRAMLLRADLVKFAKHQPMRDEHEASLASAKLFVERTMVRAAEPPPTGEAS